MYYFYCTCKYTYIIPPQRFPTVLFSSTKTAGSRWRLILAVDYQFSTNLVPLVAAPAFVPLIIPWLPLSPPAGYIRSALHITTRYISTIVHELTSLVQRHVPFLPLTINFFFLFHRRDVGNVMILEIIFSNDDGRASNKSSVFSNYRGKFNHVV